MQIIILFIYLFVATLAYSGPLDINDIKSQCLVKHSSSASEKYLECVTERVNKKLAIKNKKDNKNTNN